MRKTCTLASLALLLAFGTDFYHLRGVKRIDKDLYRTLDGMYISTRYCYHYTYGEDAILRWEFPGSYDNKIIWADDDTCQVSKVWK